jgi:hypothetical protein
MEFAFLVYVVSTIFPIFSTVAGALMFVGCAVIAFWVFGTPFWFDNEFRVQRSHLFKGTKQYVKWAVPVMIICSLVPDKETSYTMIAAYTAQSIGQNEKVQDIAGQSLDVIEAFLTKTKEELENKKESK